ncbi:hypothetical protein TELCIR_12091 [Teladorsagia circumcincta]|uniref:SCP domain-containing protein n=1 Tax=Teladorsagia circumcincta TaxID=45464 RepID=A0A2G9U7H1_TELCI|nr:hypothetical protein TELCIR_12091 [Teladorsagia circumcincta]
MDFQMPLHPLTTEECMTMSEQDAPRSCNNHDEVMTQKVRQAAVDVHNKFRNILATGRVREAPYYVHFLPEAADMRAMTYDCGLENKALMRDLCMKLPRRRTFNYTGRNYGYITATVYIDNAEKAMIQWPKQKLKKWAAQ